MTTTDSEMMEDPVRPVIDDELVDRLMAQVDAEGWELLGPEGVLTELTSRILYRGLEVEMADHLGYEKGDPAGWGSGNNRNGSYPKTVQTDAGTVGVEMPRDRNATFEPQLIPKHQRRLRGFNELVISLVARGMTTRDTRAHLQEIYGVEVSAELISKVTDAIVPELRAWQQRPLDAVYPILYLDAIVVKVPYRSCGGEPARLYRHGRRCRRSQTRVGSVAGQGRRRRQILAGRHHRAQEPGRDRRAGGLLRRAGRLRRRHRGGVAQHHGPDLCGASDQKLDPFLLVERPQSRHQSAQTHLPGGHHRSRRPGPRRLRNRMGRTISAIVDLWRHNWERFCPFLAFDAAIRKIIYTTNAIESLNYQLHKVTKTRGHFPTEDAVPKILYLAIRNIGNNRGGELGTGTQG